MAMATKSASRLTLTDPEQLEMIQSFRFNDCDGQVALSNLRMKPIHYSRVFLIVHSNFRYGKPSQVNSLNYTTAIYYKVVYRFLTTYMSEFHLKML